MKVYWVFADDKYYPCGGMGDFQESFETDEEAEKYAKSIEPDFDSVEVINIAQYLS